MAKNKKSAAGNDRVVDLLYQGLETELGGIEIYRTALECAQHPDLRREWEEYLEQTTRHAEVMREVCESFGLDPDLDTPGRQVVRHIGKSLVKAMHLALGSGSPESAELVAAECVTFAETKDHMNWSLIGQLVDNGRDGADGSLSAAYDEVEDEEDEHLYHTEGWARELWLKALGLPAQLPPPEEEEDVKSAVEAAAVKEKPKPARK
jgi:bacterioferritin (cytochrome b1)